MSSPDESITVELIKSATGELSYAVSFDGTPVIQPSSLGYILQDGLNLKDQFEIIDQHISSQDTLWEQPWGEESIIRDNYRKYDFDLSSNGLLLNLSFKLYNDGIGFRYKIPEQDLLDSIYIMQELTEFKFAKDHSTWWIPAYKDDRYEYLYQHTPISKIDVIHTPATLQVSDSLFVSIHEAALTDYPSMVLRNIGNHTLDAELVPWSDGIKVKGQNTITSSWRSIQIAKTPGDLVTSHLILNLNEPSKLKEVSWIQPAKYVGIWWAMHLEKNTWGSGKKHGATTENTMKYIDFAAENGFSGVLVEGWNEGWDGDWANNLDAFNFTKPYPDFDIEKLTQYAQEKGIGLIGHHETSAGVTNYESQLEEAFKYYQSLGINKIKTGYVGSRLDGTEWHHGQFGVRHFRKVIEMAAKYNIMIDAHEPIKDTGIRRTYPNFMTREGARGMEFDAWAADGGNPPEHTTILPFTRLLGGPMDFTPGIFELDLKSRPNNQVNTTLAKQLAYYVVIYSPLHMAADLPENYKNQPGFQFILDVPVDWSETKVLNAKIGDYITVVRKDKNSANWYLGSITDEESRAFNLDLTFLEEGQKYEAEIYSDAPNAHYKTNKSALSISKQIITNESTIKATLAPGGGLAISFKKISE